MKAAVLEKIDAPLAVKEVELTPLKFGQVLVKILVSGLCGAQLHEIRGPVSYTHLTLPTILLV